MATWTRVFGSNEREPEGGAVLQHLHERGHEFQARFHGDDQGWFRLVLHTEDGIVNVERYLATEADVRQELNTWAAWLETRADNPHHLQLMSRIIASPQVVTIEAAESGSDLARDLTQWLANLVEGVYQIDGAGFFAANGTMLVAEGDQTAP